MTSLLSKEDRLHLPNKIPQTVNCWSVARAGWCYNYWKAKLSELEKNVISLKAIRTQAFNHIIPNSTELQMKKNLLFVRLLKKEVLKNYYETKKIYLELQKKYSQHLEETTPIWSTIHGKYLHTIEVIRKSNNELHVYYYVRLNKPYTNFLDFLRDYNILDILEKEKDIYKKYDLLGFADFANLEGFFKSNDYIVEISPCDDRQVACLDFVQYDAWKNIPGSLASQRLTFEEFKEALLHNSGATCRGLLSWIVGNLRDDLERKFYGNEAFDIIDCGDLKKTYTSWMRYYDMWQAGETPTQRRMAKENAKSSLSNL